MSEGLNNEEEIKRVPYFKKERTINKLYNKNFCCLAKTYKRYAIYESLAEADRRLILQGDIEIDKDFIMRASLSDIKGISNRIAMLDPKYNIYDYDLKNDEIQH